MVILSVGRQVRPGTPKLQRKSVIVLQGFVLCLVKAPDSATPDCSPPGSSVLGIFQGRIPEWVAISPPGDLPDPGVKSMSPVSPALQADSLPVESLVSMSKAEKKTYPLTQQFHTLNFIL